MKNTNNKIGAAVIGVGLYGEVHARAYLKDPRVKLVKIWSRSAETAKAVGHKYGVDYTTALGEIANDPRIKIVSIATPDFAHAEPAIMMLRAGKNVLLEKPMATSVKECEQILKAQQKAGAKLMVNFHQRWYPPLMKAKDLVAKGKIGKPLAAFARLSNKITVPTAWLSWAGKSGPEWFLFPHIIDEVQWILNQKAVKVYAQGKKGVLKSRGIDCYDIIQAQIEFADSIASFESCWILPESWRTPPIEWNLVFYGARGRIGIQGDNEGIDVSSDVYETPLLYDFTTEDGPIKYFVDCVVNNQEPSATGEDGLIITRIIEAIKRSLATGQAQKVE